VTGGGSHTDGLALAWCNFVFDFPQYADRDTGFAASARRDDPRTINVVPQQPLTLARQSGNTADPYIEIPKPLLDYYSRYRPTPLRRAHALEARLGVDARIYWKYEGGNISGSHKLNSALAQAYYYKEAGVRHLVTGTGAGQWGTALAYACHVLGLQCTVFMVASSLRQKPMRRGAIELFGATLHASPSPVTEVGRSALRGDKGEIGTLGIATGEALELARGSKRTRFAVGSGETCVLLHQTVIGMEAVGQMAALGEFPTHVVACIGAGSNFAGAGLPFRRAAKEANLPVRLVAVEPAECPKLTRGQYVYDISDFSGTTPVSRMYTLGSGYTAPAIYAGGLRYHGTSPFLSGMFHDGEFDALAVPQEEALSAGWLFAETEGVLPAPESAHAIAGAIQLARSGTAKHPPVILINISGHGLFDIEAYAKLRSGEAGSAPVDEEALGQSFSGLDQLQVKVSDDKPITSNAAE